MTSIAAAARRGTAVDITVGGANLAGPAAVALGFPARVTALTGVPLGKDSTKFQARLEVPAEVPLGWQRLRLFSDSGLSNFRPFCVDALPQVFGQTTNHTPAAAQPEGRFGRM